MNNKFTKLDFNNTPNNVLEFFYIVKKYISKTDKKRGV